MLLHALTLRCRQVAENEVVFHLRIHCHPHSHRSRSVFVLLLEEVVSNIGVAELPSLAAPMVMMVIVVCIHFPLARIMKPKRNVVQ